MSRVLVMGGASFIGSRLTHALVASRHTVTVLDDLSTGRPEAVAPVAELAEGDVAAQAV
jgi:UDP-glucose 4-epimerase